MPSHRFALKVAINAVACDVTVNDVPVVRSYSPDQTDFTLPVSDFMIRGTNIVKIRSLVDISEGGKSATRASATLLATRYHESDWQPLFSVTTRAVPGGEEEASDEPIASMLGPVSGQSSEFDSDILLLENARMIALDADIPTWAWTSSAPIADTDQTRQSLIAWYRGLVGLMDEQNTPAINDLMYEKYGELAQAHGLPVDEVALEIGLTRAAENEELVRSSVDWDKLEIELSGNNRLARLYHPGDGTVVVLRNADDVRHSFEFWLRRDAGGWRVAR